MTKPTWIFLLVAGLGTCCGLNSSAGMGAQFEPGRPIPELRLANGTVLHEVKIFSTSATAVVASWDGGKGTIPLAQLPDDLRSSLDRQLKPKDAPLRSSEEIPASEVERGLKGLPFRLKLNNGFVMRECGILRWSEDSLLVRYQGAEPKGSCLDS